MRRSSKLKWLLPAMHVPPSGARGGMVRYTVEMARSLSARSDVQLSVLAAAGSQAFFASILDDEAQVLSVPALPGPVSALRERYGLWRRRVGWEWDVVHGTKHLLPSKATCPTLLTIHDMLLFDRPLDQPLLKRHLLRDAYLSSIDDASLLVCVSEASRARLCSYVPSARSRSFVVEHATSENLIDAAPAEVRDLRSSPFVLVVGDATPRKNLAFLLRLWPQVLAASPDAELVVAGPGVEALLRSPELSASANVRKSVTVLGNVSDAQLKWCYQHAAVVVCPSMLEGFGLPAREALDLGATVITSEDAALCEISRYHATHIGLYDQRGWREAILRALRAGRSTALSTSSPRRTWEHVAEDTVRAVRDAP